MRYLIAMYLIMTVGFFWNFQWSLVVFSMTWVACLVFRRHLPQLPYPDIQVEKMYVKTRQNVTIFLCFISPALCVSLLYQGLLVFGGDDFSRHWPPSRITDFFVSQNYVNVFISKDMAVKSGFEAIYIFTEMSKVCFLCFAFYMAHWFLFSIADISNKVGCVMCQGGSKSILYGTSWKVGVLLLLEALLYWVAVCVYPGAIGNHIDKPGLGKIGVFISNHFLLLMLLLVFMWWFMASVAQTIISVVLVKLLVLKKC